MQTNPLTNIQLDQEKWKNRLLREAVGITLIGAAGILTVWVLRGKLFNLGAITALVITLAAACLLHPRFTWRARAITLVTELTLFGLALTIYLGPRYTALSLIACGTMIAAAFFRERFAYALLAFDTIAILAVGYLAHVGIIHPLTQPVDNELIIVAWTKAALVYFSVCALVIRIFVGLLKLQQHTISETQAVAAASLADKKYIRELIDFAPDAILVFDTDTEYVVDANPQSQKLFGYTLEKIKTLTLRDLSPILQESGRTTKEMMDELRKGIRPDASATLAWLHKNSIGDTIPCEVKLRCIEREGKILLRASILDLRERRKSQALIQSLALYDNLTGLPNRKLFRDRLRQALAASERDQRYAALYFIDIDNFKNINDTSGHVSGDYYLTVFAERIGSCIGASDTVARWGGDEFVVIVENLPESLRLAASAAEKIGQKILNSTAAPCENPYVKGKYFENTVSIGMTLFFGHIHAEDELLKRADIAMHEAKSSGKNQMHNFDVRMQREIETRFAMENDLRKALDHNEFLLYYQPQFSAHRKILGAEALLRWNHPERGIIFPGNFISIAEDTGDILSIGRWIMKTACLKLKEWQDAPQTEHFVMAVNVSPRQFRDSDFVAFVLQVVEETQIQPRGLKLEITEGLMLENIDDTISKMERLREIGIRFCLDDFGTGYSSLSYLKRLPLSQLKIDQTFVRDMTVDANDAVLIRTIIGMAANLNLQVLAEGVETEEQLELLKGMGCLAYQGFLFSRAIAAAELEKLVAA